MTNKRDNSDKRGKSRSDQKLEILMQKVGTDHLQKCELKTSVKSEPYGKYGTGPSPSAATTPAEEKKPGAPPQ